MCESAGGRKKRAWLLFAALFIPALFMGGCIDHAVHPFHTEDTLHYDDRLVGRWKDGDGDILTIRRAGDIYRITEKSDSFDIRLLRLDGDLFVEYTDIIEGTRIYVLFAARLTGTEFTVYPMDSDRLRALLAKNPRLIRHRFIDDTVRFTGTTQRLQTFVKNQKDLLFSSSGQTLTKAESTPNP